MATRDMARTIVEGGRWDWEQFERWQTNRRHRVATRAYLRAVTSNPEAADERLEPRRLPRTTYRSGRFSDKVAPLSRWIDAQIGRQWDDAYAELCRRYDRRSTKGWHLIVGHVDRYTVAREGEYRAEYASHIVDEDGVLRRGYRYRRSHWPRGARWMPKAEVQAWLANRKVGQRSVHLFWFVPTAWVTLCDCPWDDRVPYPIPAYRHRIGCTPRRVPGGVYRQDRRLTADEAAFFARLAPSQQARILADSPVAIADAA